MNIANIFGMHIGCRISVKLKKETMSAQLAGVFKGRGTGRYMVKTHDDFNIYLEDCKLLLTPLDKITEEDKSEFLKKFEVEFKHLTLEKGVLQIHKQIKRDLTVYECFWLASKGYDIGICPKEYKEITT